MSENKFKQPVTGSTKNWIEPDHENCYACRCYQCGHGFFGGKRDFICKECTGVNQERSRMADEAPAMLIELTKLREDNARLREPLELYFRCRDNADGPEHFESLLQDHKWVEKAKAALNK